MHIPHWHTWVSLAGFSTVAEAVANDDVAAYFRHLWRNEIIPTLTPPLSTDLKDYAETLLSRFANIGIEHQLSQIAMDGSQKLPQRLLGTIEDRLADGAKIDALLLAVAGWIAYTADQKDSDDPMAAALRQCHRDDRQETVHNILSQDKVFKPQLAAQLEISLGQLYADLGLQGAQPMMNALVERRG